MDEGHTGAKLNRMNDAKHGPHSVICEVLDIGDQFAVQFVKRVCMEGQQLLESDRKPPERRTR
ncbi:hypothetical protein [Paraburkholderia mimosarum]|uniref:hypothetical protein n=1 Tax=Paraburkholderia mimosarum TaxID=312026 RepID=UPI0012DD4E66|nr:hypothetical protein [Paraburkholderia mimosarum]